MRLLAGLVLCAALAGSCGGGGAPDNPPAPPPGPTFDAQRAFADLQAQCAFGPRVPGSQAHQECRQFLIDRLNAAGAVVVVQDFTAHSVLTGSDYPATNVLGLFAPDKTGEPLLLGAHWDSRARADQDPDPAKRGDPVPGANDGASGVAVLLELARAFAATPPPRPVVIGFFDAEDQGASNGGGWAVGSRHLANNWPSELPWPTEMILLDLVGGDEVHNPAVGTPGYSNDLFDLPMEGHSFDAAPDLVDRIWTIAERLGHSAFQRRRGLPIEDDHLPFIERGVAAVDIIDFAPPEWHTTHDTPENCAPTSLFQVGDTLLHFIYGQ